MTDATTPTKKVQLAPPPPEETESLESLSLTNEARDSLSSDDFKTMQKIAVSIGKDGMTVEEACVLANVDYENLKEKSEKYPIIQKIIRMKEFEYKRMLKKTLSQRARGGDDKVAQWLLESRYPEEFSAGKKKGGGENGEDLLGMAIDFIQNSGDSQTLVRKQVVVSKRSATPRTPNSDVQKLKAFLV